MGLITDCGIMASQLPRFMMVHEALAKTAFLLKYIDFCESGFFVLNNIRYYEQKNCRKHRNTETQKTVDIVLNI